MFMDDYKRWAGMELEDPALSAELESIAGNEEEIKERFAVALKFGTAGLRGVLGAGSNRMNIYVVRQATQGLANWVKTQGGNQLVAISYDSRINSDVFAKETAKVLIPYELDMADTIPHTPDLFQNANYTIDDESIVRFKTFDNDTNKYFEHIGKHKNIISKQAGYRKCKNYK